LTTPARGLADNRLIGERGGTLVLVVATCFSVRDMFVLRW